MSAPAASRRWRHGVILFVVLGSFIGLMLQAPIPQDLCYHAFADRRPFLGIPNFLDVVSNLPFLLVGLSGLSFCRRATLGTLRTCWVVFFVGVSLVSVGSGYYHWWPENQTLVWDRLPMTIGFMALFVALLAEAIDLRIARMLLWPAIAVGAASVLVWALYDDLRFYAWVQFCPLLVIPALLILYPARFSHQWLLVVALGFYLLAKVFEAFDCAIYTLTRGVVAGHAIKHLLAAAGCQAILLMLRRRTARTEAR